MKKDIDLSISVAMTPKRIIGSNNKLPWHLPSDLRRFKENTMGAGVMLMGHNTYASILARNNGPLPKRKHIVLTRKRGLSSKYPSVTFVRSIQEAYAEIARNGWRAFVIGGGEIFEMFFSVPEVRTILLTTVYAPELTGDTFFPEINGNWNLISESEIRRLDPEDDYETSFKIYERFS